MFFEKQDVTMYYELRGEGAPLVMIHGAAMDADWYKCSAEILASQYQVLTYDRRGSSRSKAEKEAAFDLDTQVQDLKDLLDELGMEQVFLVGASAGANIAHRFFSLYPDRVKKVILYEPAMVTLLEGTEASIRDWVDKMKELIGRGKINTAMFEFVQSIGELDSRAPEKDAETNLREMNNLYHFLPHEYETFVEYRPDLEATRAVADKLVVAVGDASGTATYATAAKQFAACLDKKVLYYPGLHNAPYDLPTEFAVCVMGTLLL